MQGSEHAAHSGVERSHHLGVGGQVTAVVVKDIGDVARYLFVLRTFPWPMRRGEVKRQEERVVTLLLPDTLDRALGQQVRVIANLLHRHLAFVQVAARLRARTRFVREIVDAAAVVAEEDVITALERTEHRQEAQVPFAEQGGPVAGLLQQRGQRRVFRRQADAPGRPGDRLFQAAAQAVLVEPYRAGGLPGAFWCERLVGPDVNQNRKGIVASRLLYDDDVFRSW